MKYIYYILTMLFMFTYLSAENRVEFMVGDVKIQSQGSAAWKSIKSGMDIRAGDTIKTGKQSFAMINADGNSIKIQPNTKVKFMQNVVDNKHQSSFSLFSGSVNCKMDKLKKEKHGYNVYTAAATCAVRGTVFDVAAGADGNTILQVTDGTVAFRGNSESLVVLKDQESSVKIGGEPTPVKIIKRQNWEKWANETTNDVAGKEKDIISGCLKKIEKLDSDITQLEQEAADAKEKSQTLKTDSDKLKEAGDLEKAGNLKFESQKNFRKASSLNNMAFYQASRIDLVKEVADNAYNSASDKSLYEKEYKEIMQIYSRHYLKYIKPINDSIEKRKKNRDKINK